MKVTVMKQPSILSVQTQQEFDLNSFSLWEMKCVTETEQMNMTSALCANKSNSCEIYIRRNTTENSFCEKCVIFCNGHYDCFFC
jgi:hypothetical protein